MLLLRKYSFQYCYYLCFKYAKLLHQCHQSSKILPLLSLYSYCLIHISKPPKLISLFLLLYYKELPKIVLSIFTTIFLPKNNTGDKSHNFRQVGVGCRDDFFSDICLSIPEKAKLTFCCLETVFTETSVAFLL